MFEWLRRALIRASSKNIWMYSLSFAKSARSRLTTTSFEKPSEPAIRAR